MKIVQSFNLRHPTADHPRIQLGIVSLPQDRRIDLSVQPIAGLKHNIDQHASKVLSYK